MGKNAILEGDGRSRSPPQRCSSRTEPAPLPSLTLLTNYPQGPLVTCTSPLVNRHLTQSWTHTVSACPSRVVIWKGCWGARPSWASLNVSYCRPSCPDPKTDGLHAGETNLGQFGSRRFFIEEYVPRDPSNCESVPQGRIQILRNPIFPQPKYNQDNSFPEYYSSIALNPQADLTKVRERLPSLFTIPPSNRLGAIVS